MKKAPLAPLDIQQRYTVPESIEYLRNSRASLYALIKSGKLPTIKEGRRTYVPGTAIAALSKAPQ